MGVLVWFPFFRPPLGWPVTLSLGFLWVGRMAWLTMLVVFVVGCSDGGSDQSGLDFRDELSGRVFVATALVEDGAPRPIVAGTEVRMVFGDDFLGLGLGCNGMRGEPGGILQLASQSERERTDWKISMSAKDCAEQELHDQDTFLGQFLFRGTELHLDGSTLTVTNGTDGMVMVERP